MSHRVTHRRLRVFVATSPDCIPRASAIRAAPSTSELMVGVGDRAAEHRGGRRGGRERKRGREGKKKIAGRALERRRERRSPIMRIDFATETNSAFHKIPFATSPSINKRPRYFTFQVERERLHFYPSSKKPPSTYRTIDL